MKKQQIINTIIIVWMMILTLTPIVQTQVQRYFQVQTTDTSASSLTVAGGIVAGTGANQIVDATGAIVGISGIIHSGGDSNGSTLIVGTNDANNLALEANNVTRLQVRTDGITEALGTTGRFRADTITAMSNHAFETTTSGMSAQYYKLGQITIPGSGSIIPGATEGTLAIDASDHLLKANLGQGAGWQAIPVGGAINPTTTWLQWRPTQAVQPTSAFATFNTRNDHPIIVFPDGSTTTVFFEGTMPSEWTGNSVTANIQWASPATTGNVVWGVSIERIDVNGLDIDADSFATEITTTQSTSGTSGVTKLATIDFTTSASRDTVAAGDGIRIRVRRIGGNGSDTLTNDAQLVFFTISGS